MALVQSRTVEVFADYHQFYLEDVSVSQGGFEDMWTDKAIERMLAVLPNSVAIATVRNYTVP